MADTENRHRDPAGGAADPRPAHPWWRDRRRWWVRLPRRGAKLVLARSPVPTHPTPDFLIIGAQKAATTSLWSWLIQHPSVLAHDRKEHHFFDRPANPFYDGGDRFTLYRMGFPSRATMRLGRIRTGGPVATGEATPVYLFHELVPARIAAVLPDVKLIVNLRDPVSRAYSHHAMVTAKGHEDLPAAEAFAAEEGRLRRSRELLAAGEEPEEAYWRHSYLARGLYADQLERWWRFYRRDQMLITTYEELARDPAAVYSRCIRFLGLDPDAAPYPPFRSRMVGAPRPDPDPGLIEELRAYFADSNARLEALTGIDYRTGVGPG